MEWKRTDGIDENAGFANPDEAVAEFTAYYTGPDGAEAATSYYVKEHAADETNMPYDPAEDYPRNEDGEKVLYSVEEVSCFTPADDPDAAEFEYGEGSAFWYWTLEDARREARRLAAIDFAHAISWDGKAASLVL